MLREDARGALAGPRVRVAGRLVAGRDEPRPRLLAISSSFLGEYAGRYVSRRGPANCGRVAQPCDWKRGKAPAPAYFAASSSSSSMRSNWLYLATRSERAGAPVLI